MFDTRLTLRVTRNTDVKNAVAELDRALAAKGFSNPPLMALLIETGQRFQRDILDSAIQHDPAIHSYENRGAYKNNSSSSGTNHANSDTVMRGEGYSVRITTRQEGLIERLTNALLRRPSAFS